jgi:hypothetical protein
MTSAKDLDSIGPFVHGVVVRGVSEVKGVRRETFLLGTLESPMRFYAQLIAGSSAPPAEILDVYRIEPQSKLQPAIVYATRDPDDVDYLLDRFARLPEVSSLSRCDVDFEAILPGRTDELNMYARGFGISLSEDPWFDASVCAYLTRLWVMETNQAGRVLSMYILPVALDSTPSAVAEAFLARLSADSPHNRFEPFAFGVANAFAFPNNGMPLFGFVDQVGS